MGWFYTVGTRDNLLRRELLADNNPFKVLNHRDRGSHLWRLIEFPRDGQPVRLICLDLIESRLISGQQMWGNKPMDESMGPFEYDCPFEWLAITEPFKWGRMSEAWRAGVREYHKHSDIGCGNFQAANAAGRAAHDAASKQAEAERQARIDGQVRP